MGRNKVSLRPCKILYAINTLKVGKFNLNTHCQLSLKFEFQISLRQNSARIMLYTFVCMANRQRRWPIKSTRKAHLLFQHGRDIHYSLIDGDI